MALNRNPNLGLSERRRKRRRLFLIRLSIIASLVLIIVLGLAILSGYEKMRVETIIVSGQAAVSSDEVLAIANRDMAGRYGYLFARNNSLIFPRGQIRDDLLREIRTISFVDISWDSWRQISIRITERKPHSVWCGNDSRQVGAACYFVDSAGLIYSPAPDFTGYIYIRDYGNVSEPDPVGQAFLPTGVYREIFFLIDRLDKNGLPIALLSVDGASYRFELETGQAIVFDREHGLDPFSDLLAALSSGQLDLSDKEIDYIDLRFDNQIVIGRK